MVGIQVQNVVHCRQLALAGRQILFHNVAGIHQGIGVLKSTDGGATWVLAGNSGTVLLGAQVTKVVIDADTPNIVYVAVAAGGASGPGVYRSTDGGTTWANVLVGSNMILDVSAGGGTLGPIIAFAYRAARAAHAEPARTASLVGA